MTSSTNFTVLHGQMITIKPASMSLSSRQVQWWNESQRLIVFNAMSRSCSGYWSTTQRVGQMILVITERRETSTMIVRSEDSCLECSLLLILLHLYRMTAEHQAESCLRFQRRKISPSWYRSRVFEQSPQINFTIASFDSGCHDGWSSTSINQSEEDYLETNTSLPNK